MHFSLRSQSAFIRVVAGVIGTLACSEGSAIASCSLIPPADEYFVSETTAPLVGGLIDSPLGAPGRNVRVAIDPCKSPAPPLLTDPVTTNTVRLILIRPNGSLSAPVLVSGVGNVRDCQNPAAPGRCLVFTIPPGITTTGAGPAKIEVVNGNGDLVIQIGKLYRTKDGCSKTAEETFSQFTILPEPNSAMQLANESAPTIRATVDGGGNLLIPLNYSGLLADDPATPIARFITGAARVPAMSSADPEMIMEKVLALPNPSSALRSFTLQGRPLPPLLVFDNGAPGSQILGAIDAVESVLRIARVPAEGSPAIYDMTDRLPGDGSPLILDYDSVKVGYSVHLDWIRRDANVLAFGVDESREDEDLNSNGRKTEVVAFIKDTTVYDPDNPWGINTGIALAGIPAGTREISGLAVANGHVALLEDDPTEEQPFVEHVFDGGFYRLYDSLGTPFPVSGLNLKVERQAMIAATAIEQDDDLSAFFSKPLPTPHAREAADPTRYIDPANFRAVGIAVSPDGRHIYAGPFGTDGAIETYTIASNGRPSASPASVIQAGGDDELPGMVFSDDGRFLYVSGSSTNKVYVFERDSSTGELTLRQTFSHSVGFLAPGRLALFENDVYVPAFDSDAVTHLHRDPVTGLLSFVNRITDATALKGAFGIAVSPDGRTVYVGASRGFRLSVYSRDPVTGNLTYVERFRNTTNGVSGLAEPRDVKVSADGTTVYVASANDDGLTAFRRDTGTGLLTFLGDFLKNSLPGSKYGPYGIGISPDGHHVVASTTLGGDPAELSSLMVFERNPGDGSLVLRRKVLQSEVGDQRVAWSVAFAPGGRFAYVATFDGILTVDLGRQLHVVDSTLGDLSFNPPPRGVHADLEGDKAVLIQGEDDAAADVDGDGDRCDRVLRVLDTNSIPPSSTGIPVPVAEAAVGNGLLAFTIDESSWNEPGDAFSTCHDGRPGTDIDGNGSDEDRILAVSDPANPGSYVSLDVDASDLAILDSGVVFLSSTTANPVTLPGPSCPGAPVAAESPRFLHYYRGGPNGDGDDIDFGIDAVDFVAGDSVVALRVSEAIHGHVLNDDGDCDDTVMVLAKLPVAPELALPEDIRSSGRSVRRCELPGCFPGLPYKVANTTVSFLIYEIDEVGSSSSDLNHNDSSADVIAGRFTWENPDQCTNVAEADADNDGLDDYLDDPAPPAGCAPTPLADCAEASLAKRSKLDMSPGSAPEKQRLRWQWTSSPGVGASTFGNPTTAGALYSVCLYDNGQLAGESVAPTGGDCGGRPCWRVRGKNGFQLNHTDGLPAGIDKITLRSSGAGGVVGFSLSASGENLLLPSLPVAGPLVAQMVRRDSSCGITACWSSTLGREIKNTAETYKGTSSID